MTNKFVVINSLKYQKLRKFYYMKRNFLYQITAASRTLTKGLPPPDPRPLCPLSSTEFVDTPPPKKKIPGYATGQPPHCFNGSCRGMWTRVIVE